MQANGVASSAAQGPTVERLERDEGALTDEQRMSAVTADAPELAALLSELQGSLAEVRSHVGPVLKEVRAPCAAAVLQLLLCCYAVVLHLLLCCSCCCDAFNAKRSQCLYYRKVQHQSMQPVSACPQADCASSPQAMCTLVYQQQVLQLQLSSLCSDLSSVVVILPFVCLYAFVYMCRISGSLCLAHSNCSH